MLRYIENTWFSQKIKISLNDLILSKISKTFSQPCNVAKSHCGDPSGVLILSNTWYSQLSRVEPTYRELVIQNRIFLLFRVGYTEYNIFAVPSRLCEIEYFCY